MDAGTATPVLTLNALALCLRSSILASFTSRLISYETGGLDESVDLIAFLLRNPRTNYAKWFSLTEAAGRFLQPIRKQHDSANIDFEIECT